jgi:hypothetical protein
MKRVGCLSRAITARVGVPAAAPRHGAGKVRARTRWPNALRTVLVGLVLALGGATASTAAGEAVVTATPPNLTIAVKAFPGPDGDTGLAVEPGVGSVAVGRLPFGVQPITSPNAVAGGAVLCSVDLLGNTVTCPFFPSAISIQTGDGDDQVHIGPSKGIAVRGCVLVAAGFTEPPIAITADLGPGNDRLSVPDDPDNPHSPNPVCPAGTIPTDPTGIFNAALTVDAGPGNDDVRAAGPLGASLTGGDGTDVLVGGDGADLLQGGAGNDSIDGGSGSDVLSGGDGNDVLNGGAGNDQITGGNGDDVERGNFGDDTFHEDLVDARNGADIIDGGPGFDTVDYSRRTAPLTIKVFETLSGDGAAGELDNVVDVDRVLGGSAGDFIVGSGAAETLVGGPGADSIDGGGGPDNLQGGPDNDTILAVDGVQDTVSCGDGSDRATLDLKDTIPTHPVTLPTGVTVQLPDCELVIRQAVDDSPPGRPIGSSVRLADGGARVRFSCPPTSRPSCRGRLVLADAAHPHRPIGYAEYSLSRGSAASIDVHLAPAAADALRRVRRAVVRTVERGHSRIGPRGAEYLLRVRLGAPPGH